MLFGTPRFYILDKKDSDTILAMWISVTVTKLMYDASWFAGRMWITR